MQAEKYWLAAHFMEFSSQKIDENMDGIQPVNNYEY